MKPTSEAFNEGARLLTVKQAATRLGCSIANIYGLINSGDLAVVSVGQRKGYRVDLRDLDAFVEARKVRFVARPVLPPQTTLKHLKL